MRSLKNNCRCFGGIAIAIAIILGLPRDGLSDGTISSDSEMYPFAVLENCVHFEWGGERPIISVCGQSSFYGLNSSEFRFPDGFDKLSVRAPGGKEKVLVAIGDDAPLEPARFATISGKGVRYITEIRVRESGIDRYYPIKEQDILCQKKTCMLTAEKCVLQIPKSVYPNAVADYERATKKAEKSGIFISDEYITALAEQLMVRALSDDSAAAKDLKTLHAYNGEGTAEAIGEIQSQYEEIRILCAEKDGMNEPGQ